MTILTANFLQEEGMAMLATEGDTGNPHAFGRHRRSKGHTSVRPGREQVLGWDDTFIASSGPVRLQAAPTPPYAATVVLIDPMR